MPVMCNTTFGGADNQGMGSMGICVDGFMPGKAACMGMNGGSTEQQKVYPHCRGGSGVPTL